MWWYSASRQRCSDDHIIIIVKESSHHVITHHHTSCFKKRGKTSLQGVSTWCMMTRDDMTLRIFLMRWLEHLIETSQTQRVMRDCLRTIVPRIYCDGIQAPQDFLQRKKISSQSAFVFHKEPHHTSWHQSFSHEWREHAKRFYYSSLIIKYPSAPPRRPSLPFDCHSEWYVTLW